MLNKKLHLGLFALTSLSFASIAFSQELGYWVETDTVFLPDSTNLNRDNYNLDGRNVTVWGGTATSLSAVQTAFSNLFDGATTIEDKRDAFTSFLNNTDLFVDSWETISVSPGTGPAAGLDWAGDRSNLTEGSIPALFIATHPLGSAEPIGLAVESFVGLVLADGTTVPSLGGPTVGFNQPASWNTAIIGSLNSLTLAAIPEPRVYAAVFGIFALGFVLWRRRRA